MKSKLGHRLAYTSLVLCLNPTPNYLTHAFDVKVDMDKILVVDDDQESCDLLCEVLVANGYAAQAVSNAPAARQVLRRDPECRIVIADFQMPQESGLELLRQLREENSKHEIILMSSFMSGAEKQAAKALGAHALLDKPFQLTELLQVVAELAAQDSIGISS
jgi:CheY-like chemotaxis protein